MSYCCGVIVCDSVVVVVMGGVRADAIMVVVHMVGILLFTRGNRVMGVGSVTAMHLFFGRGSFAGRRLALVGLV